MTDKRIHILRDMDTSKAITKLAIPAIIGFMVMAIYNLADTIFISWWNPYGTGATQVLFPIMMISSAIGLTFGIGGASYISRLLGEKQQAKANSVVSTAMLTGIVIGAIYILVTTIFLRKIVVVFGAKNQIIDMSVEYGFYIVIGSIFVIMSMILNNSLRAEGSGKYSMYGMATGSFLNILIDPLFIFTFGMGIKGAALATMISQAISCLILYYFYFREKTILRLSFKNAKPSLHLYQEILKIGMPTFFRQILFSVALAILNRFAMFYGGENLLAAMGDAQKIASIPLFFIFGIGQGMQPVIGYNYGAKNTTRVLSAQKNGMKMAFAVSLLFFTALFVFARPIMAIFTDNEAIIKYGVLCNRAFALGILFTGVSNTISVVFQALGHGLASLFFSIMRQGVLLISAIYILSAFYGETGVIFAQFAADVVTFLLSILIYLPFIRKMYRSVE